MNVEDIGERRIKTPARAIMVNRDDNVAVVLNEVRAGEKVILGADWSQVAVQNIPVGHKMAIASLQPGDAVIKFGQVIGVARQKIEPGEYVHLHNLQPRPEYSL
jgi:altronate hydrolase